MTPRSSARRDLVLASTVVIAMSRLADGPLIWLIAVLVFSGVAAGSRRILADIAPTRGVAAPPEATLIPGLAAAVAIPAIRLVPIGLGLVPALLVAALVTDQALRREERLVTASHPETSGDRAALLAIAVVVAFVGFVGAAVVVPGGLVDPGAGGPGLTDQNLLILATVDGLIAGLLGYRLSALRQPNVQATLWSAATYASAIAIGAAALRAMGIPRLVGPALLTLVFFLWDAFHGASPARRRDPRWIWQTALLLVLGVAVVVWNLGLRA
jgi:hypothetical protein